MWTSSSLVSSCRLYESWGHPNPHGTANLTSTLSPFTTLFHISVFFRAMCGSHENNGILQNSKALIYQELSHEPWAIWAMSYLLPTFCSLGHRRQCYELAIYGHNPKISAWKWRGNVLPVISCVWDAAMVAVSSFCSGCWSQDYDTHV